MGVDTALMLTIAEVSATFVAIVSGLYTSKILSLSAERQRVRNKIREIDAELKPRENVVEEYEGRIHNYNKGLAEEIVRGFEVDLLNHPLLRQYSLDELFVRFQELRHDEPDELDQEVIRERFQSITESIREELAHRTQSSSRSMGFNLPEHTHVRMPKSQESRLREERDAHEWEKRIDDEHAHIDILSESKKNYEQELKSSSFPRHIAFGYVSQVSFAIVGVVFPLTYGSWSGYAGDYSNMLAIGLFVAGLATTFIYIISEALAARHEKQV